MGTTASIRFAHGLPAASTLTDVRAVFGAVDARFSLYDPESELSRIARGEIALTAASETLRGAYALALEWRTATDGAFTPHRPDGLIDLSGVVKALAIAQAGAVLRAAGEHDWLVTVGGDTLGDGCFGGTSSGGTRSSGTRSDGTPEGGEPRTRAADASGTPAPWQIGVVDPADRTMLLTSAALGPGRLAIATSGVSERGEHIWRRPVQPHHARVADDSDRSGPGRAAPKPFAQVTVVAADIITADVLATAIVSGGHATLDLATERYDIDVLCVDTAGQLFATPGFRAAVQRKPERAESAHAESDRVEPAHAESDRVEPAHAKSDRAEPAHAESDWAEPDRVEPEQSESTQPESRLRA